MENKIITRIRFDGVFYEHSLKYIGIGHVRYFPNITINTEFATCEGYELSGISKRYRFSKLENLYQTKKHNPNGTEIIFNYGE